MKDKIFLLFTAISTFGCHEVRTWDKGFPKPSNELKTDEAKREEFQKFAIDKVTGGNGNIQTVAESKSNFYYDINSFSPVVLKVSPSSERFFSDARFYDRLERISGILSLAGIFAVAFSDNRKIQNAGWAVWGTGLVGSMAFNYLESSEYRDMKGRYLNDLNNYIYGGGSKSSSNDVRHQGFELGLSWNL